MKEDIKKIWVDALRSGDYGQGVGCTMVNPTVVLVFSVIFTTR